MKLNEKSVCSFENWYPLFKDISVKSVFLVLPDDVLDYLKSHTVTIPVEVVPENLTHTNWDSEGEDEDEIEEPSFPEFSAKLKSILNDFGGQAFIKLNWSAPTDAAWVATNNCLKCTNLQDIYLLLKCSYKISKDLQFSPGPGNKYYIVLKKWEDIHPGTEFRCFVLGKELVAITQRDSTEFHEHILNSKHDIVTDLKKFFKENLKGNVLLSNYIFDVVWLLNRSIKLIDIGIFNDLDSDAYLFSWDEIKKIKFDEELSPEFRFISEHTGIQPHNLSTHFGMPRELTDISYSTSQSLIELLQTQIDIQSKEE